MRTRRRKRRIIHQKPADGPQMKPVKPNPNFYSPFKPDIL
jgi:hypothetical protein